MTGPNPAIDCGGDCSLDKDFTGTISGVSSKDPPECSSTPCESANGDFTFTAHGDGSYTTSPVLYVCALYNWGLSGLNDCYFELDIGFSGAIWEGRLNTTTGVLTLHKVLYDGGNEACNTPQKIILYQNG